MILNQVNMPQLLNLQVVLRDRLHPRVERPPGGEDVQCAANGLAVGPQTASLVDSVLALWYFPECRNDVLSTGYVNLTSLQPSERRVQRCARPLKFHSTSPM